MAGYKQPCLHCGNFIEPDARFCPVCGSGSPFGYLCPACLRPVAENERVCAGCGRSLHVICPHCGRSAFVRENCDRCGKTLMVRCDNPRCGVLQFFENGKCTACGKKMRAVKYRQ